MDARCSTGCSSISPTRRGSRRPAGRGANSGFDGKTLIHPTQIEPANEAFAPSADEIARARRLVAAYTQGVAAGKGAIRHEGRLVEALHVEAARRTLALAEAIGERGVG